MRDITDLSKRPKYAELLLKIHNMNINGVMPNMSQVLLGKPTRTRQDDQKRLHVMLADGLIFNISLDRSADGVFKEYKLAVGINGIRALDRLEESEKTQ